jgi:2-polyprenyl-3-methyl-5-hydroxy-6-metoxy-1,4-benzoquinol methylase
MSTFKDAREHWNQRFARPGYLFGQEPNAFLAAHAGLLRPGMRALCVADGEGRNSVWLAGQGLQVDAFDLAELGVEKARALAASASLTVNYEVADCEHWRWPQSEYDLVAAIFIQFADPAMRERLFARMIAALKPGGLLLVQGYTPRQLEYKTGGPGQLENLYTSELMHSLCKGLDLIELREYEAELSEGSQHAGRSALLGLVARKPGTLTQG